MIALKIISLIYLQNNIDTLWGKNLSFGYKNEPCNISMMLLQYILQTNHALHHICCHLSTNKLLIFIHQIIPNRFIHIHLWIYILYQRRWKVYTMTRWYPSIYTTLSNCKLYSTIQTSTIQTFCCIYFYVILLDISMYPTWHALPIIHWSFSPTSFFIFLITSLLLLKHFNKKV